MSNPWDEPYYWGCNEHRYDAPNWVGEPERPTNDCLACWSVYCAAMGARAVTYKDLGEILRNVAKMVRGKTGIPAHDPEAEDA